ncbi:MAG: hypothetical protein ABIG39_03945 [Candidatus Micrarchaeota archaeon]
MATMMRYRRTKLKPRDTGVVGTGFKLGPEGVLARAMDDIVNNVLY